MGDMSAQDFVAELCERYPDDAEDLQAALEVLRQQRISTVERLGRLGDSQWQRLALPLGVEALLQDEVARQLRPPAPAPRAAPRPAAAGDAADAGTPVDDDGVIELEPFEQEGVRRRGVGGADRGRRPPRTSMASSSSSSASRRGRGSGPLLADSELSPPQDLEQMWQQLLEDTLTPDKRAPLQEAWASTPDPHDRYMMLLEYSSYLRKPEISEKAREEGRRQMEPLLKEFGLSHADFEEDAEWSGMLMCFVLVAAMTFVAGLVYYFYTHPDVTHDLTSL